MLAGEAALVALAVRRNVHRMPLLQLLAVLHDLVVAACSHTALLSVAGIDL